MSDTAEQQYPQRYAAALLEDYWDRYERMLTQGFLYGIWEVPPPTMALHGFEPPHPKTA